MLESLLRTPGDALRYLVKHDAFVVAQPMSASAFVDFCKEREIDIDLERLERLERLGVFCPLARVEYPRIQVKVERVSENRIQDHGMLQEGETWDGELKEENSRFSFRREWAETWLESGSLWDPRERPFQPWDTFHREGTWERRVESFYSPFQTFVLHNVLKRRLTMRVYADLVIDWSEEDMATFGSTLSNWAKTSMEGTRDGLRSEDAAFVAQLIANRYFFHTEGDRRTINVSEYPFEEWDWWEFSRTWDAAAVASDVGLTPDEIAGMQLNIALLSRSVDPLERWYELVSFVSPNKREQLKDAARFAQLGYGIEHMLRLFYQDVTGNELRRPHERHAGVHVKETADRVPLLNELEYLVNRYHLNPKPQLILVVEGDGEAEQFPRLARELLGHDFAHLGIEVRNLRGIGNFTGSKTRDRHGALEKFIDDHHYRQTIVFCILDREGRAETTKDHLLAATSKFVPGRKLTCEEYINLWNDSVEFDNFSDEEIAAAMTRVSEDRYTFSQGEVATERKAKTKTGNPLNELYTAKLPYGLNKVQMLEELVTAVIASAAEEHAKKFQRPIVSILMRAIKLAANNHQPVSNNHWRRNQDTGFFGPLL